MPETNMLPPEEKKWSTVRAEFERELRAEFDERLAAGLRAIEELERATRGAMRETRDSGADVKAKTHAPKPFDIVRASWAEAIDWVLTHADRPLFVTEIVDELKRLGRTFPANTAETVTVSAVITRRADSLGWISSGVRPKRWRKKKEASAM